MNVPESDPMAGVDFARGVACNTKGLGILSAVVRPRSDTLCTLPAKPSPGMLIAASRAGGVTVEVAAAMYLAMIRGAAP